MEYCEGCLNHWLSFCCTLSLSLRPHLFFYPGLSCTFFSILHALFLSKLLSHSLYLSFLSLISSLSVFFFITLFLFLFPLLYYLDFLPFFIFFCICVSPHLCFSLPLPQIKPNQIKICFIGTNRMNQVVVAKAPNAMWSVHIIDLRSTFQRVQD